MGIIVSLKQILVSVNHLIWTLAASNFGWAKISYSAYGQTGSGKTLTMKTPEFETKGVIIILLYL